MLMPIRLLFALVLLPVRLFFKLPLRLILEIKLIALGFAAGLAAAYGLHLRDAYRTWGLVPGDRQRTMSGDDAVPGARIVDTRSLTIEASPADVWSWLVQLGYGRIDALASAGGIALVEQLRRQTNVCQHCRRVSKRRPHARSIRSEEAVHEDTCVPCLGQGRCQQLPSSLGRHWAGTHQRA